MPDGGTATGASGGVAKTPEEGTEPVICATKIESGVCASANEVVVSSPIPSATYDEAFFIKRFLFAGTGFSVLI
jgi:hypothetical protein